MRINYYNLKKKGNVLGGEDIQGTYRKSRLVRDWAT